MREEHGRRGRERRLDGLGEHLRLHLVGEQQRDELCAADGLGDRPHLEPGLLGLRPRGRPLAKPDDDADTRVVEVERMGVALAPVADDGHRPVEE